jgi:hypothetical protein
VLHTGTACIHAFHSASINDHRQCYAEVHSTLSLGLTLQTPHIHQVKRKSRANSIALEELNGSSSTSNSASAKGASGEYSRSPPPPQGRLYVGIVQSIDTPAAATAGATAAGNTSTNSTTAASNTNASNTNTSSNSAGADVAVGESPNSETVTPVTAAKKPPPLSLTSVSIGSSGSSGIVNTASLSKAANSSSSKQGAAVGGSIKGGNARRTKLLFAAADVESGQQLEKGDLVQYRAWRNESGAWVALQVCTCTVYTI